MDSKELRGLMEAYSEVYAPEQIDEVLDTPEKANEYAKKNVKSMVGAFVKGAVNKDISQLKTIEKRKRGAELAKRKAERKVADEQNEEVEQIDEISAGLAGKVVNARIAATGAASDRAYKHRNPEAMRAAETAADKEGRARKLAAGVRSRRAKQNEEFELWVNELVEEGHDLSDYTWDEVYEFYLDEASSRDEFTRAAIARNSGRKGGITFEPGPNWDSSANRGKGAHISPKQKEKQRRKGLRQEELDIFDIVLEFLQVEGYAETLEEAEWIMANELDSEDIEEILEAEGSYGQTPKARTAMGKLAISRMRKPATEYSQKGEKTRKVKAAEKQTRRQDVLSRGLSGGKKSSRPSSARGKMDADERSERRAERAFDLDTTYGAGSVTKNPKKLRKQKAMGEHD